MGWHYAALEERFRRHRRHRGCPGDPGLGHGRDDAAEGGRRARRAAGGPQAPVARPPDRIPRPASSWPVPRTRPTSTRGSRPTCARCGASTAMPTRVEPALVEALARATTTCEMTWREARAQSDFAMLAPELTEVVRLVRETATRDRRGARPQPLRRAARRAPARPARRRRSCRCSTGWRRSCRPWSRRSWPARPRCPPRSCRPGRSRPSGRRSWAGR